MRTVRVREVGFIALGGMVLLGQLGLIDDATDLVKPPQEPQQLSSASDPWSEDYNPQSAVPAVYYRNCDAARAAGVAPLHAGEPGYADHLDRDGDGSACEPYYGR